MANHRAVRVRQGCAAASAQFRRQRAAAAFGGRIGAGTEHHGCLFPCSIQRLRRVFRRGFRRRFDRVRPMIDQTNRWQVDLLKDARAGRHKDKTLTPLLMTMNCIAAGLGWTG